MSFTLCRTISAAPNRAGLSARNPQANRVYGLDQASWPAKSPGSKRPETVMKLSWLLEETAKRIAATHHSMWNVKGPDRQR